MSDAALMGKRLRDQMSRLATRIEVIQHYGGCCACCGESRYEFLSIDHVGGTGASHRRDQPTAYKIIRWLRKNGYPPGFRVLCYNCNCAIGFYGYCPHENRTGYFRPKARTDEQFLFDPN